MSSVRSTQLQKASNATSGVTGNPIIEDKCQELIACIAQVGGTGELKDSLHKHMPDQASEPLTMQIQFVQG